jgi:hypothetical protein
MVNPFAKIRLCLASQAAPLRAPHSHGPVPFLWSCAGLACGGARGDAGDVHGRRARTLGCACMRRSYLHSPSHARRTHPQMHAVMHHFRFLVGALRGSCALHRFTLLRQREVPPKAESVDGEHASLPSRKRPQLHRLRPIRTCTTVIPPNLLLAMQLFMAVAKRKAETRSIRDPVGH